MLRSATLTALTLAVLVAGAPPAAKSAAAPSADSGEPLGSGLVEPGLTSQFRKPRDGTGLITLREIGQQLLDSTPVTIVREEHLGVTLERFDWFCSRDGDGDILLHGVTDRLTQKSRWYEPPAVLIDLPLEPGKQWRVRGRCRADFEGADEGTLFDQVRGVAAVDTVRQPAGNQAVMLVTETISAGDPLGELWYAPGLGIIAKRPDADAPWQLRTASGPLGPGGLNWAGREAKLHFNWPRGRRLHVDKALVEISTNPDRAESTSLSYDLLIEANGDGLRLRYDAFADSVSGVDDRSRAALDRLQAFPFSFTVDAAGAFEGLDDAAAMRDSVVDWVMDQRRVAESAERTARIDSLMRAQIGPELMSAQARFEWDLMVGMWLAVADTTGKMTAFETTAPLGLVPGAGGHFTGLVATDGYGDCPDAPGDECLLLSMSLILDDSVFPLVLRQYLDQNGLEPLPEDEPLHAIGVRQDWSVVLDPRTSLPRSALTGVRITVGTAPDIHRCEVFNIYRFTLLDGP